MRENSTPDPTFLYFSSRYRMSPFFEATRRAGCKAYGIYNHMYYAKSYDNPVEEYWHLVNHVTLWDVGVERVVEITGPDASAFTNMLTPRDLTKCAVGQCKYVLITAEDVGIINDPGLSRIGENEWWLALADSDAGLWARGVAVHSGLDVTVREPDIYPVQVQGPKSKHVMQALFKESVLDLRYYWNMEADLDGVPVVVCRTGYSGEVGYEIYLRDPSAGDMLWNRIMEAGEPYDIRPIVPCQARRVEAGIFSYGADMTIENNPFEIMGLERLVEDQAADYIGKEALMGIKAKGVKQRLVGIEMEGEPQSIEPLKPFLAYKDGMQVGPVTIAIWSPRLKKNIGYVWVPIELSEPGIVLDVEMLHDTVRGRTASIPFIDPKKTIPKSQGS